MQSKFKAGDKVKCVDCNWGDCKPNEVYEVASTGFLSCTAVGFITLKNDSLTYSADRFELYQEKRAPHKHADVIKAWADGAIVQVRFQGNNKWHDINEPNWTIEHEYRVKPEPKPDSIVFQNYYNNTDVGAAYDCIDDARNAGSSSRSRLGILKLTFDGETGKLKFAEVVSE